MFKRFCVVRLVLSARFENHWFSRSSDFLNIKANAQTYAQSADFYCFSAVFFRPLRYLLAMAVIEKSEHMTQMNSEEKRNDANKIYSNPNGA